MHVCGRACVPVYEESTFNDSDSSRLSILTIVIWIIIPIPGLFLINDYDFDVLRPTPDFQSWNLSVIFSFLGPPDFGQMINSDLFQDYNNR